MKTIKIKTAHPSAWSAHKAKVCAPNCWYCAQEKK